MINYTLKKLTAYRAPSLVDLLEQYGIKGPVDPWLHVLYYRGVILWYVWDSREIVHIHVLKPSIAPKFYGELAVKGKWARDNKHGLVDSNKLLRKTKDEHISRLLEYEG